MSPRRPKKTSTSSSGDILVVGGGSFGTALATILVNCGRKVTLWVRREDQAREINQRHTNKKYFPDKQLPKGLKAKSDLREAIAEVPVVLVVVPSEQFREVARKIGDVLAGDQILLHATKGIERGTFKRMSEILREETCALKIGVLSGPNLAKELMAGYPAGATLASHYAEVVTSAQALFSGGILRLYGGWDVIGTEIAGAFKNIIALASGASHGLGFGDNTKALIVTRGLVEMTRYGMALGAEAATFSGLAGIGDLMATCSSPLSRNFRTGVRLAQGETAEAILSSMNETVEGVPTARAVYEQGKALGLELPMVEAVYEACFEGQKIRDLLARLMERRTGPELAGGEVAG